MTNWKQLTSFLLDLLFPPRSRCAFCGRVMAEAEPGLVCHACQAAASHPAGGICPRCGRPVQGENACTACQDMPWAFSQARSIGPYDGELRHAIHRLKFRGQRDVSRALAELLYKAIDAAWWQEIDSIVPVPLHAERLQQRGFNQAEQLAYQLALLAGRPMRQLLVRRTFVASQTGLGQQQRRQNVRGAFQAAPGQERQIVGQRLLLVDDVLTTGSTLDECARVLLQAGAREVRAATAAITNIRD